MLSAAVHDGLGLLLWSQDSFAYADSFDEANGRYRGLRCGQRVDISHDTGNGLVVRPETALKQQEADAAAARPANGNGSGAATQPDGTPFGKKSGSEPFDPGNIPREVKPRRYYGTVKLDAARVGRDAGRVADEVIAHLGGLVGATVTVTLEIEASIPDGAPDKVVRTVTENSRTLGFSVQGFERD